VSGGDRPSPSPEASPGGGATGEALAPHEGASGEALAPHEGASGDALAPDTGGSGEGVVSDGGAAPKRERKKGKRKGGAKGKASAKGERDVDGEAGGEDGGGAGDADGERGAGDVGDEGGGEGKGAGERKPMGVGPGRRFAWSDVENGATFAGLAALIGLIAAGATQSSQWTAAPFVLLFYLALLGAAAGTYAARRAEPGTRDWFTTWTRRVLWGFVGILALWFWLPPSQNAYFWLYRHLSVYLLSM
jgi:hypothetical protein